MSNRKEIAAKFCERVNAMARFGGVSASLHDYPSPGDRSWPCELEVQYRARELFAAAKASWEYIVLFPAPKVENDRVSAQDVFYEIANELAQDGLLIKTGITSEIVNHGTKREFVYATFSDPANEVGAETPFQEDFHKCLVSGKPLYDEFSRMAHRRLPDDANSRYQRLRTTGFVMKDEADIDVYTDHVAARHIPKFQWLYSSLFKQYKQVFTSPIGLVVWGCGCGLDLIAIYDQAMKEGNPNFWLVVQDITLVDISDAALKRAREIAELLFPTANIQCKQLNLKNTDELSRQRFLESLFPYATRVHLLSNILDLFNDVRPFSAALRNLSARLLKKPVDGNPAQWMWNDVFIAFSPEYRNGIVRKNMSAFRDGWTNSDDLKMEDDRPMNCEYCAFSCNSLKSSPAYREFVAGTPLLRRMVRKMSNWRDYKPAIRLMRKLCSISVNGKIAARAYEYFDELRIQLREKGVDGKFNEVTHTCVFCVAGAGEKLKPLVVVLNTAPSERFSLLVAHRFFLSMRDVIEGTSAGKVLEQLEGEIDRAKAQTGKTSSGIDENKAKDSGPVLTFKKKLRSYLKVTYWNENDEARQLRDETGNPVDEAAAKWDVRTDVDYSPRYVILPEGVEKLPSLTVEQRAIACCRKQLKKIKGGPGVGKTVTMLWHAFESVRATHLPALILCKTVSLINYNKRRLAATWLSYESGQEGMDANLFRFETIDDFLCKYVKNTLDNCILRKCGSCVARCKRHTVMTFDPHRAMTAEEKKRDAEIRARFNCKKCHRPAEVRDVCKKLGCADVPVDQLHRRSLTPTFMNESCRKCKIELVKELKRKNKRRTWEEEIGSVMIDEAQIADPDFVKSVYNLTGAGNPWREFYMFCDAQQAFRHRTLEQDSATKTWNVTMPDRRGFGNFEVLKENHRMKSRALIEACRIVQKRLKGRDSELTFYDWANVGRETDGGKLAFSIEAVPRPDFARVKGVVDGLRNTCGAESVAVICEEQAMARQLSGEAMADEWVVTHLPAEDYEKEKELRQMFYEHNGCNHLTSVDCAQGQSFEAVVFILTSNREQYSEGTMEQVFTALSRSGRFLRVLDASPKHWLCDLLELKK